MPLALHPVLSFGTHNILFPLAMILNSSDKSSSSPAALPIEEAPEVKIPAMVPSVDQKLSDGSAFKGNAAGYLERRSDIIKSW